MKDEPKTAVGSTVDSVVVCRVYPAVCRCAPRAETRDFDPDSPNGRLMVAVCTEIMKPNAKSEVSQ